VISRARLLAVYRALHRTHGPQHWWPGDGPFEVMVGAVLTQNTTWAGTARAIGHLRQAGALEAGALLALDPDRLAQMLRPARYGNLKAGRLRALCAWYLARGGHAALAQHDTAALRSDLLGVRGIGPETADDILLYAFGRPVFVIDAYTRRLLSRLGLVDGREPYERLRAALEAVLGPDPELYGEFHALIVAHGKGLCRPRPACSACGLRRRCPGRVRAGPGPR
jgi:endonuclease-3 related protein